MVKEIHIKKSEVLEMLQKIDSMSVIFTDKNENKGYTAKELIQEVENETRIGIAYTLILEEMCNPKE